MKHTNDGAAMYNKYHGKTLRIVKGPFMGWVGKAYSYSFTTVGVMFPKGCTQHEGLVQIQFPPFEVEIITDENCCKNKCCDGTSV